jgi:large subunit ribosomal protein L11
VSAAWSNEGFEGFEGVEEKGIGEWSSAAMTLPGEGQTKPGVDGTIKSHLKCQMGLGSSASNPLRPHQSSLNADPRSNARTAHLTPSTPTPTQITINPDRTFSFTFRTPPVSYLLKAAASIDKGSGSPGTSKVGTVSLKHVYEIARIKCRDEALGVLGEEKVARGIVGSAKTLGLDVVP